MESSTSIGLSNINQSIKTKTISLNSNSIYNLLNVINSTTFTSNILQMAPQWKSVIVFYSATSKPIAYIALSENEERLIRFPDEGHSNSKDLINLVKSLLQ
jgi:hypothetical protein